MQKSKHTSIFFWILVLAASLAGCKDMSDLEGQCFKGKYLYRYCDAVMIQVLDKRTIGRPFNDIKTGQNRENVLAVYIDTTVHYVTDDPLNYKSDSVFYFKIREGTVIKKSFIWCETDAHSVTLDYASPNPCQ